MSAVLHSIFRWVTITPLGLPVEPEVNINAARSRLESTSGNYKVLVELFNMKPDDYKRFLGFLRKYHCHIPFQQFRSAALSRPAGDETERTDPLPPTAA